MTDAPRAVHIPSLDGIRAVAFLLVFVAHAGLGHIVPGGLGVSIFFFLSGFLITSLLRVEFATTGTISLRQFYLRRVLRILPPLYLTLTILVLATEVGFLPGKIGVIPVTAQVLFLGNYYSTFSGIVPEWPQGSEVLWSLSVEEHFYMLFPFLAIFLFRRCSRGTQGRALIALCVLFLAWRCLLVFGFGYGESRIYQTSDCRMDSILFGCLLAVIYDPSAALAPLLKPVTRCGLYGLSFALIVLSLIVRDPRFRETFRYTIQGIGLLPLFFLAVTEHERPWFQWLNWKWIRFLGLLSYSLYLIHLSILRACEYYLPPNTPILSSVLTFALSLAYALAMYVTVERPLARLRKRLHRRTQHSPVVVEAERAQATQPSF